ncbi:SGNH/GDSL hydrolase family protein [Deinococcus yavapaiensis]|uniref:GDSL-like lipase/acylhydrolase family protein n=1 Tax=Deinococcus yavapaiensis KR-236 TaxID=694435 RepID=A0A318SJJ5_9DEIO|nr:GDSL-type esterase/lipase family protein [Deinococcus yavapaiensis]PYE54456.1 GDSL-like lipase/acylhydrolase family protein [Deinococcus yavapaiensis KR-236]
MKGFLFGGLTLALAACSSISSMFPPAQSQPPVVESGFSGYVALGDSLTAGAQSAGLTASGQSAAYPVVLSRWAGHPINAPLTNDPGCPPPLGGSLTAASCTRANPGAVVSNFALTSARVADLTSTTSASVGGEAQARLYNLVLGANRTQVEAALAARPKFLSIWIGANDVLDAALFGDPSRSTSPTEFQAAYRRLLTQLQPLGAKTVLITVPDVTAMPALIPGPKLAQSNLKVLTTIFPNLQVDRASCAASENFVSASTLIDAGSNGGVVSCNAPSALTPSEAATIRATVGAYNASIRALAGEFAAKVLDVSTLLPTAADTNVNLDNVIAPFGPDFSLDGAHPSGVGQAKIARTLGAFLNAQFGTAISLP